MEAPPNFFMPDTTGHFQRWGAAYDSIFSVTHMDSAEAGIGFLSVFSHQPFTIYPKQFFPMYG